MNNTRHTAETAQTRNEAAREHGPHAALFVAAFDAATELLDATHAVYDTEAYKADGIDPTEQTRFEVEERGDDVVADGLVFDHDDDDAWDVITDAVAAACEAWQPHDANTHQGRAARFMAQHGGQRCEQASDERATRVLLGDCCHDFHASGAVTTYDVRFGDEDTTTYADFLAEWDTVA